MTFQISLSDIKKLTGLSVLNEREGAVFCCFAPADESTSDAIIFIDDMKHAASLEGKEIGLVITPQPLDLPIMQLVTDKPRQVFFTLVAHYSRKTALPGVHSTVIAGNGCSVSDKACIGPYTVLGERVTIGAGAVIHGHCQLGDDVTIGENTIIFPLVSIYHEVDIGSDCIIHSGVVIGADGYGFAETADKLVKIPQIGRIEIGNDVEIGANTCIDRATLGKTLIENGVKIDNLVQIAHNVRIREHARIVSQVGIAGSTDIGRWAVLAGQAGLADHIVIGDRVVLTAQAGIGKSLTEPGIYSGTPARPMKEHYKILAYESKLEEMWQKIKQLEKKINEYEANAR